MKTNESIDVNDTTESKAGEIIPIIAAVGVVVPIYRNVTNSHLKDLLLKW